jgi:hypothetical protein
MASTYSTNLKIELMSTGENSGSWGTVTNTNLGTALEQSIVGYGNPSYPSDANLTITLTDSNAAQAARALVLNVTSAVSLTVTRELVVPTVQKQYIVQNNTTGAQSITVKTSAGSGITVPNGRKAHLYVDGTNVIQMFDFVDINGGTIDGTTVGATTASSGAFTTLGATGNVTLGDASADTVTVNGTATFAAKPTVQLTSAATNTVTQVMRLDSQSSGTPAAGIGVGLEFAVETAAGNTEVGATLDAVTTDVTSTSEDFDLLVKLMIAGAAAVEVARFKSTGLSLVTGDTYQINNVDVLSATALGTSVVGSSLTSVGTIATGVWQGSVVGATYGGTGINNGARTLTINTNAGTIAFSGASTTMTFPSTSQTLAGLALAQTFTAAQTFRAANAVRSEAAATQDAIVLAGRAGGTSSFAVTLTPTTLTASRTITLPDGDVTIPSGTVAVLGTAQTFTAAQTFRAANAVRSEAAATQDAIILAGRAGGTGSFAATITTATLAASVTHTLPAITGTLATLANTAQTFTGATTFSDATTTFSATTPVVAVPTNGLTIRRTTASQSVVYPLSVTNSPTGTWTANAGVGIQFNASYNNTLVSTAYKIADLSFSYLDASATSVIDFSLFSASNLKQQIFYAKPSNESLTVGTFSQDFSSNKYVLMETGLTSLGSGAGCVDRLGTGADPTFTGYPAYGTLLGINAGAVISSRATAPGILYGQTNTAVGGGAGSVELGDYSSSGALSIQTGQSNTYLGYGAGKIQTGSAGSLTRGDSNIGVGSNAGLVDSATYGTLNIAIGSSALRANAFSIGNDNIAIGSAAGYAAAAAIGDNNIFIGYEAGLGGPSGLTDTTVIGAVPGTTVQDGEVVIGNGQGDQLFHSLWSSVGGHYQITLNNESATILKSNGGVLFYDSEFKIVDNVDSTKVAVFDATGITAATTRTYTLPNASGTLALLSGTQTFSGSTTFSSTFTLSGTTQNISLGTSQTSGTMTMGGTAGTGTITLGRSTGAQTLSLAGGATTSGTTKTVDIGTAGVSGSITNINIGSAVAGSLGTISLNEQLVVTQPTPVTIATTATLTNANILTRIVIASGATDYTITLPLGTTLETLVTWVGVDLAYDFTFIPTGGATVTLGANTGVTIVGANQFSQFGGSVTFRIRRTAANTFIVYNMG